MAEQRFALKNARLAFAKGLWTAEKYKGEGEAKFKVKLIVGTDHPQIPELETLFSKLAKEEWKAQGETVLKALRGNPNKFCFIDGDNYSDTDGFAGNMALSASTRVRPTVVGVDGASPVSESDGIVYSGCYVNALLEFRTMSNKDFGKGLFCTLRGVQFFRTGDAFTGGAKPADVSEFTDLSAEAEDDPTA